MADTVGAIVGGSTDGPTTRLTARFEGMLPGESTVLGSESRVATPAAGLLNGTAGTVLELDEGHKYAAGHPAIHVLPAVLAVAEAEEATIDTLVASFVAGYEVAARVARASHPLAEGYHPHGVWGAIGAAAGVSRLRGRDAETTLSAMRIAATHAQHTRMAAATEGATVRNLYAGKSNLDGILAVEMAAAGFTGIDRGLERHLSPTARDGFRRGHLSEELGNRWEVLGGYFKRHAACRYTHAPLDAVAEIQEREDIDPDAVETIRVETYPAAAGLTPQRPKNPLQAKFSVPFAVATRLLHGHSNKEAFERDALSEAAYDLAERVHLEAPADLAERLPDARSARVTVTFDDGRERSAEVTHARGGTERPWTEPELAEKFAILIGPLLGDKTTQQLWQGLRELTLEPSKVCEMCHVEIG
jgi:2-methylcitrate dehydratase PrpD